MHYLAWRHLSPLINLYSSTSITLSFRHKLTIGAQPGFRSGKGPISSVLRVGLVRTLAVRNWLRRVETGKIISPTTCVLMTVGRCAKI